ncbi:MAG TPA: hypothetical protein VFP68_16205 [Burkholderiaceae bacterium]|nr:hypothetical protein [Burkholderiaceae bacterium]
MPNEWDEIDDDTRGFYRRVLEILNASGVRFLVGGAFAFAHFTGIKRHTKDLDLFILRQDFERVQRTLDGAGYRTQLTFPHWLGKVHSGDAFVDLIFSSGNGIAPVDEGWFAYGHPSEVLGVPVKLAPPEESLWSKAFVMERERYDGADVAHLLRTCGRGLDWQRLRFRFGPNWRVLLSHLVLFGYIFPGERDVVPPPLMDELLGLLHRETHERPPVSRVCAGTLLSREQYLPDVQQRGYEDGRIAPLGVMSPQDVSAWTAAISARREECEGELLAESVAGEEDPGAAIEVGELQAGSEGQ